MPISSKILFLFIILILFENSFAENIDKFNGISKEINNSAQKTEISDKEECYPLVESYNKFVFEARHVIATGKDKYAERYFKKHLVCWYDKAVYIELAEFYDSKEKYYLAGLAYKKAGATDRYNQSEQKRIESLKNSGTNKSEPFSQSEYSKSLKKYKVRKTVANILFVFGPIAASTGLGLFIHDNAGGTNSKIAQYTLMMGGLTMISGGILSSMGSVSAYNDSRIYFKYGGDDRTLPKEYYEYSGAELETKQISAKSLKKHGAALMSMSIPLFAVAVYSFIDRINYEKSESDDPAFMIGSFLDFTSYFLHGFIFLPGIASLSIGAIMLYRSSKYEKLSTAPNILTLTSITPIMNPVSKTYGLALGFSF